jgi:hypothetical protein
MTRQFNAQFHCNNCKTWQTQETMFGRWIRNNPDLDSAKGYCVTDQDYWIHRFKVNGSRGFQCIMLVEVKTMGAELSDAQKDTIWIIDQITRNRRVTPTKKGRAQSGSGPSKVRSIVARGDVELRAFGAHILTFSSLGPDDSDLILWDGKPIETKTLTSLLRFDLDPDTLRRIDLRNHHQTHENKLLSLPLDGAGLSA